MRKCFLGFLAISIIMNLFIAKLSYSYSCENDGGRLTEFKNVAIYANGCNGNTYWQCVEFAKRFYYQYHHFNVVNDLNYWDKNYWSGHGKTYSEKQGLVTYKNNVSVNLPRIGDTISFIGCNENYDYTTVYGHVAIVAAINDNMVYFYQQNVVNNVREQLVQGSVSYSINNETSIVSLEDYEYDTQCNTVLGWASPKFSMVEFSLDNKSYTSVYGIINKPLYSKIQAINSSSEPLDLKGSIHISNLVEGDSNIVEDEYEINGNSIYEINKQINKSDLPLDSVTDHTYRFLFDIEQDDNSLLDNVVKRELILSFLLNDKSVIVDDSEISENFIISGTLGIANIPSHSSYYTNSNMKIKGYLYGSILVNSDSEIWAQWRPKIEGTYSVEVFIPSNGCNQIVQYKIKPDGDNYTLLSKPINQDSYVDKWVPLQDENDNHLWLFNKNGYVELVADYAEGKKVGFDAVRFTYHKINPVEGRNKGNLKIIGSKFGNSPGSVAVTSSTNRFDAELKKWSDGSIEIDIFNSSPNAWTFKDSVKLEIRDSSDNLIDIFYYPFRDVEAGKWFSTYATRLWKHNVIDGKGKSFFFAPGENTNFAEFFKMLINSSSELFPNNQSCEGKEWYCPYFNNSSVLSWIDDLRKIDPTRGEPSNLIKRQEVAFFLSKAVDIPWVTNLNAIGFNDVQSSNQYAQYIVKCKELNIFNGYQDGNFKPDKYITRAEIAKVLYRTFYENNIDFSMFKNN